jgi:hypothetical protein
MSKLLRQPTKQPDLRPAKLPPSTRRYEQGAHDTPQGWLHGGRGEDKPNFDPGLQRKQKKLRPRWPF